jgi:hypothetical protein
MEPASIRTVEEPTQAANGTPYGEDKQARRKEVGRQSRLLKQRNAVATA